MVSSQIRQEARSSLTGKWGKAALLTLIYSLITFLISFVLRYIPIIGNIVFYIISVPLAYGILVSFIKLKRNEEVGYLNFFTIGFSVFGKLWGIIGYTLLKLLVPLILVVVSIVLISIGISGSISMNALALLSGSPSSNGLPVLALIGLIVFFAASIWLFIKSLHYVLTSFILYDNPNLSSKEIVEQSESLMTNQRASYVWLQLSFIGWAILSVFTLFIGLFWLEPYMMIANIIFYEDRVGLQEQDAFKEE